MDKKTNHNLEEYPELVAFVEAYSGSLGCSEFMGWPHAESLVWKLEFANKELAFLKVHKRPKKFIQESQAYENWVSKLGVNTPKLLSKSIMKPKALLLSAVPGDVVDGLKLSTKEELDIYRQAGTVLKTFHSISFNDSDIPLNEALKQRLIAWSTRAEGLMPQHDIDWVSSQVAEILPMLINYRRVPCHRDFTPRNWLVNSDLQLAVIDFEHSRADLSFLDVERLWAGEWLSRPDLQEAFWDGYGSCLTSEERSLLARLAALGALSTIVWAREHNDAVFENQGWQTLERLKQSKLT